MGATSANLAFISILRLRDLELLLRFWGARLTAPLQCPKVSEATPNVAQRANNAGLGVYVT